MGKLFGSGSTANKTETSPWAPAEDALKDILGQAGDLFDKQGGINAEWIDKQIADLTPEMQEYVKNAVNTDAFKDMATGIQQGIQTGQSNIGQATGGLGGLAQQGITGADINKLAGELYDSDLVKSQKGQLGKDIESGLAKSTQAINQAAGGSGNMGSSRAGVAEGVAIGEAADAYASGAASIDNAARQSAMGQAIGTLAGNQSTALGAFGQMGQLGVSGMGATSNAYGQMGSLWNSALNNQLQGAGIGQSHNQNILNNNWFNAQGQQNAGWNNLNNYLGIAGSIGGMGSTTTGSGGNSGLGGALVGAAGSLGSAWIGKSDQRLKDNIEVVKEAHTRVNPEGVVYPVPTLYKWDWNSKALALFAEDGFEHIPPAFGVMAQELEATGFEKFVEYVETSVPGLDGKVRVVNYPALLLYVGPSEDEVEA